LLTDFATAQRQMPANVCCGSKAEVTALYDDFRFTLKPDVEVDFAEVRFVPTADVTRLKALKQQNRRSIGRKPRQRCL
jgi:hypothetical protein